MSSIPTDMVTFLPIFAKSLMEDKDEPLLQWTSNRLAICAIMVKLKTEENWEIVQTFPCGKLTYTLVPVDQDSSRSLKPEDIIHWAGVIKTNLTRTKFFCEATRIINNHMGKLLNAN